MKSSRLAWTMTALVGIPALAFAGEGKHKGDACKSPTEVKQLVDRCAISTSDAIQLAESKSGGKAFCAGIMEWSCVRDKVASAPQTGDVSQNDLRQMDPSHPVARAVCVTSSGQLNEVLVCCKMKRVLASRTCNEYSPARSVFYSETADASFMPRHDRWSQPPERWQRVSDLTRKPVCSKQSGEHIGDIKALALDPDAGRVIYQIVQFHDKMGHGNRWFAIPISVAKLSDDYKRIEMDYTSAQVNNANGFDPNTWPNLADVAWGDQVFKAYGRQPYWVSADRPTNERLAAGGSSYPPSGTAHSGSPADQPAGISPADPPNDQPAGITGPNQTMTADRSHDRYSLRAPRRWQKSDDLMGKPVIDPRSNENLGTLKEIVVDPDSGRVLYGVLSFGGFLGLGDKLFAIPWGSLELASDGKALALAIDKDRLKTAQGFDRDNWPNLADERWAANVHDFYGRSRDWETQR